MLWNKVRTSVCLQVLVRLQHVDARKPGMFTAIIYTSSPRIIQTYKHFSEFYVGSHATLQPTSRFSMVSMALH
jgi:hypothetical protein